MEHRLFDLHCDTSYRLYKEKQSLRSNNLHIALDKASYLSKYAQIAAIWSDCELSDEEAYLAFWRILNNFKREIESNRQRAAMMILQDFQTELQPFFLRLKMQGF